MLRMELHSPSYYSFSGETAGVTGDPNSHSDKVHSLSLLMNATWAGEMPLPPELFTEEQICSICQLHAHASPLTVGILNGYECLLEFVPDCDFAQIAQDPEKVACWHEVPVSIICITSSDRNHLQCISRRDKNTEGGGRKLNRNFVKGRMLNRL